ncbi:MAG: hypothetical protein R2845_15895 [Thermomicrobiales bacterium]
MIETDLEARADIYRQIQDILVVDNRGSSFVANQFEGDEAGCHGLCPYGDRLEPLP